MKQKLSLLSIVSTFTLILGGCANAVQGDAVAIDTIGMFDPCAVLTESELREMGVDPASEEVDITGVHIPGFNVCTWTAEWFYVSLYATKHSLDEVEANPEFINFARIQLVDRNVLRYTARGTDLACGLAFSTASSTALLRVEAKVTADPPEPSCALVERLALTVMPRLPE